MKLNDVVNLSGVVLALALGAFLSIKTTEPTMKPTGTFQASEDIVINTMTGEIVWQRWNVSETDRNHYYRNHYWRKNDD